MIKNKFSIYKIPIYRYDKQIISNKINHSKYMNMEDTDSIYKKMSNVYDYSVGYLEVMLDRLYISYVLYLKLGKDKRVVNERLFSRIKHYNECVGMLTNHTNISILTNDEIIENIKFIVNQEKENIKQLFDCYIDDFDFLELLNFIDFKKYNK